MYITMLFFMTIKLSALEDNSLVYRSEVIYHHYALIRTVWNAIRLHFILTIDGLL